MNQYQQTWTADTILAALHGFALEHKRLPLKAEYDTTAGLPSDHTRRRFFSTLADLAAAYDEVYGDPTPGDPPTHPTLAGWVHCLRCGRQRWSANKCQQVCCPPGTKGCRTVVPDSDTGAWMSGVSVGESWWELFDDDESTT